MRADMLLQVGTLGQEVLASQVPLQGKDVLQKNSKGESLHLLVC